MRRGNGRLDVVLRHVGSGDGPIEVMKANGDEALVPPAAILIREQHQIARFIDTGGQPCALKCHQRDQGMDARRRDRGRRDEPAQAQRLHAEILPDQLGPGLGRISLVEHEVDYFERRIEARRQFHAGWQVQRQTLIADLALRANEPLRNRSLVRQERAGDFADAEAADNLQAERHAGIARERRMAAHENHPELVVPKLLADAGIVRGVSRRACQLADNGLRLVAEDLVAPQGVNGHVVRDAKQPAGGVVRDSLVRPGLQRTEHRVLDGFLGERNVFGTEETRQAGHHAARLMPEQVLQQHASLGRSAHDP